MKYVAKLSRTEKIAPNKCSKARASFQKGDQKTFLPARLPSKRIHTFSGNDRLQGMFLGDVFMWI